MLPKNILLTGIPGCGKTTVIKNILSKLGNPNAMGFFTEEIKENKERKGFRIHSLDGQDGIMAEVGSKSPFKVSKYGVDIDAIEDIGANAILKAIKEADIIVIDEIGKMELFSDLFKLAVLDAFNSSKLVLGTISLKDSEFTCQIKEREDTIIFEVNQDNREMLVDEIIKYLRA
jgi:nucleoside-triphosphatase